MSNRKHDTFSRQLHKSPGIRGAAFLITLLIIGGAAGFILMDQEEPANAYPAGCVSQACREAADAADAAERNAASAAARADSLEDEVNRLNAEIASLEADIRKNQAIADDLSAEIATNEAKLNLQQAALAKLLVNTHFEEESDPILLLAGSNSLGDYAEKQSRQTNAKTQIAASAEAVRRLKDDLAAQKLSVDALIASAESSRAEIESKRNQQSILITRYQNNAEAYARDAIAARETMQREIAAEIAHYNSNGVVGEGYNSYPYADRCPRDNVGYIVVGGYVCQCTSYAGWKAQEFYGIYISAWGDAKNWGNTATRLGYVVNNTPAPHTIAYSTSGIYGHVMWVESVNANGTINLTEYNNSASSKSGLPGDFGARYNVNPSAYRYIHLDQRLW